MISTIFTWNRITDKYRYYFYTDLLTDVSLRIRLTNILKSDDNTHLYCGCSFEHDKEIFISDEGKILFPKGIPHSTYCVSYIKEMLSLGAGSLSPFITKGGAVPVNFTWKARTHKSISVIDTADLLAEGSAMIFDLASVVTTLNALSFQHTSVRAAICTPAPDFLEQFMKALLFDMSRITLKDKKGELLPLSVNRILNKSSPAGDVYFFYGKVLKIDESYKRYTYVRIHSVGECDITITVDQSVWGDTLKKIYRSPLASDGLLFMAGLVETKVLKSYKQGSYDPYTGMSTDGSMREYKANILRQGVLFFANDYGLMCSTKEQFDKSMELLDKGYYLERAFLALPRKENGEVIWERPFATAISPNGKTEVI